MINKNFEKLFKYVNKYSYLLYIGKSTSDDDIKKLQILNWSCIITSRTDDRFCNLLEKDGVRIQEIFPNSDINLKTKIDEKGLLPVIRLFGVDGIRYINDSDDFEDNDYAEALFQKAVNGLDSVHRLLVTNYDSKANGELNYKSMKKSISNAPNCSVQFWNCNVYDNEKAFRDFCGRKRHLIEIASLTNALDEYISYLDSLEDTDTALDDVFFSKGKEISYNKRLFGKQSGFVSLLTVNTVLGFKPIGKEMLKNSYLTFLDKTPIEGPQWFGYQPDCCFYSKRNYEEKLYKLVTQMLKGHLENYDKYMAVLQGPSGSSKSVVMGAVAYRIFEEKQYPVIYINNSDSELFAEGSADYEVLDAFLQKIEEKIDRSSRTLVVWDCSAYSSGELSAIKVMNYLRNNGRRFVMLCSSYKRKNYVNVKPYRIINKGGKRNATEANADFFERGVCYCVDSTQKLDDSEKNALWKSFYNYSGLSENKINQLKKEFEEKKEDNINYIFYRLFELIRPRIEAGLSREEDEVVLGLAHEINELLYDSSGNNIDINSLSAVQRAMLKAGRITVEEITKSRRQKTGKTDIEEVFATIAMFSKLKIPVPYQVVLSSLKMDSMSSEVEGSIIDLLSSIPLLYYHRTENGFCFSYRNSFEAEIFLKNKDPRGEREFQILRHILSFYKHNVDDIVIRDMILEYLRLMGPNSNVSIEIEESRDYFKNHLADVINDLADIVDNWREINDIEIATSLVWTYLTFTREYYKHKKRTCEREFRLEDYKDGIDDLQYAKDIANEVKTEIERCKNSGYYNRFSRIYEDNRGITVEYALISVELQRLVNNYLVFCRNNALIPEENYSNVGLEYKRVYESLCEIIPENPTNGYIFNALFRCFEYMYDNNEWNETDKLNNLVYILRIISECNTLDIINYGNDDNNEFEMHIQKIYGYVDGHNFSIEEIKRRDNGELDVRNLPVTVQNHFSLYDSWMENKNPVGICFVCYKELYDCNALDLNESDDSIDHIIASCEKVVDFMYKYRDNFDAVKRHPQALFLLIKSLWMYINKSPLSAYGDRKMTKISQSNWKNILNFCRIYNNLFNQSNIKFREKIIVLIYAIAEIQVNKDFNKAFDILDTLEKSSFVSDTRKYTPYMLCDENGIPQKFSGEIIYINNNKPYLGKIMIHTINYSKGIHFNAADIGKKAGEYKINERLSGLEIGIGYMGPSIYTEKGRKYRGDKVE